jgi:hypothetical protein
MGVCEGGEVVQRDVQGFVWLDAVTLIEWCANMQV